MYCIVLNYFFIRNDKENGVQKNWNKRDWKYKTIMFEEETVFLIEEA